MVENSPVPADRQIHFRIGINLGDEVNVAARIQSLAVPGGILVSDPVHERVKGRWEIECEFAGEESMPAITVGVLPFDNMSDDGDQSCFCDWLGEDLTTRLPRSPS